MKTLLLIFLCICFHGKVQSQEILKLKTTGVAWCEHKNGHWGEWSQLMELKALITIDSKDQRIKIYTDPVAVYDVTSSYKDYSDSGESLFVFNCIDKDGGKLIIQLGPDYLALVYNNTLITYSTYFPE